MSEVYRKLLLHYAGEMRQINAGLAVEYSKAEALPSMTVREGAPSAVRSCSAEHHAHAREPGQLHAVGWDTIARTASRCQVIVSAISHSTPLRADEIALLPDDCLCAGVRYGDNALFAREARAAHRPCIDGGQMLFGQFWTAVERVASIHRFDISKYHNR